MKLRLICQYVAADFLWIYFTNCQEYPLDIFYKLARIYQYHLYYFLQIYFTNWQEITIDMLVRGDAFQVFIQAILVSLQAPGRLLNYQRIMKKKICKNQSRMSFNKVMLTKITFKELMTHKVLQFVKQFRIQPRFSSLQ